MRLPGPRLLRAIVSCAAFCVASAALVGGAEAQTLTRGPYVQNLGEASVTLVWRTDVAADSMVEYGPTPEFGSFAVDATPTEDHVIVIGGLEAGTSYHYRIWSGGIVLADGSVFRTANPETDTQFDFIAFGDTGSGTWEQWEVAAVAESIWPRFILESGHVVNPEGEWYYYDPRFFLPYATILREIPIWPVMADHDYMTDNGAPYYFAFHLPANNPLRTEQYYSFDYGNAHFIGLDIETDFSPGSPQFHWLVNELRYHRKPWNFVHIHAAPYSSSIWGPAERGDRMRTYLSPLFEIYGVDIVFCGAKHHYERFFPIWQDEIDVEKGVQYVVSAGGGQEVTPVYGSPLTAYFESVHHLTHTTIDGDQLVLDAIRIDGTLMDSFTRQARIWNGPLVSVAPEDLVLHLDFDECDGDAVLDSSIYAQHGYLGAEPGPDAADPVRDGDQPLSGCGALRFDPAGGDDFVTIPNDQGLFDPDEAFTLTAWVRCAASRAWSAVASGGHYRYAMYLASGGAARGYFATLWPTFTPLTDDVAPLGEWSHVAMVYDGGSVTFYVEGVPQETTVLEGTLSGVVDAFYIGWDGYAGDTFDGWIDEVKVYRRALEAQEVRAEMVSTLEEIEYPPVDPTDPPREPIGPDDLVCRLAFDEPDGQQVLDASSRGNHGWLGAGSGIEASDPTRNPYAKWGAGALDFDGADDVVSVADLLGDFDFDEEFTAMAWVRYDDDAPWRPVLSGGDYEYALYLDTDGAARAYFRNLDPLETGATATTLSPGAWHHVTLVKELDLVTLYLDGQLARTTSVTGGFLAPVALFRVGHDGYPGDYFRGSVDEVKVYRRALIAPEIESEMNSLFGAAYPDPVEPPPPGPAQYRIAQFLFEETDGQVVLDASGHGRHGYLGDGPDADARDPERILGGATPSPSTASTAWSRSPTTTGRSISTRASP